MCSIAWLLIATDGALGAQPAPARDGTPSGFTDPPSCFASCTVRCRSRAVASDEALENNILINACICSQEANLLYPTKRRAADGRIPNFCLATFGIAVSGWAREGEMLIFAKFPFIIPPFQSGIWRIRQQSEFFCTLGGLITLDAVALNKLIKNAFDSNFREGV